MTIPQENPKAQAARAYIELGYRVVPLHHVADGRCSCGRDKCRSPGKHPATPHGYKDAIGDQVVAALYWDSHPEANIGLLTGEVSNLAVIDVDPRNQGDVTLAKLEQDCGPLPHTAQARTGGGGAHYLYQYAPALPSQLGAGIDLKTDGGYIVVPPSTTSGPYEWVPGFSLLDGCKPEPFPLEFRAQAAPRSVPRVRTRGDITKRRVSEGERNNKLCSIAGALRKRGLSVEAIEAELLVKNQQMCMPPLDDDEVLAIASSIMRYESDDEFQERVREHLRKAESKSDAIAELLADAGVIERLAGLRRADQLAFRAFLQQLEELPRLKQRQVHLLREAVQRHDDRQARAAQDQEVRRALPDAPVPEGTVTPAPHRLGRDGVFVAGRLATAVPLVIVERQRDMQDGTETLVLAWLRQGQWHTIAASRGAVMNARRIVELADQGLPVTSHNATTIVEFLADFEQANFDRLPVRRIMRQFGWQSDGSFVLGRRALSPGGITEVLFKGNDVGEEDRADAYTPKGSADLWNSGVKPLQRYPRVMLLLLASLAAPLMKIVGDVANFIVDLAFTTSTGKTTALRIAASVWGQPDEARQNSLMFTWNSTPVAIERMASIHQGLPIFLDDTKRASNAKLLPQIVYDIASGKGRGRGSIKGLRRTGTFVGVLLVTGESRLVDAGQDGGTRARVVSLWGPPFGDLKDVAFVTDLNRLVSENHGHAGPTFVAWLLANHARFPEFKERYRARLAALQHRAGSDPVAGRMVSYLALVQLTEDLAIEAGALPWEAASDPVATLLPELLATAAEADRAIEALERIYEWACANPVSFDNRGDDVEPEASTSGMGRAVAPRPPPPGGFVGRWDRRRRDWEYIGWLPQALEDRLLACGFDAKAVIGAWRDRGWLHQNEGARGTYRAAVGSGRPRLIALRRDAIERITGLPEAATNDAGADV